MQFWHIQGICNFSRKLFRKISHRASNLHGIWPKNFYICFLYKIIFISKFTNFDKTRVWNFAKFCLEKTTFCFIPIDICNLIIFQWYFYDLWALEWNIFSYFARTLDNHNFLKGNPWCIIIRKDYRTKHTKTDKRGL